MNIDLFTDFNMLIFSISTYIYITYFININHTQRFITLFLLMFYRIFAYAIF